MYCLKKKRNRFATALFLAALIVGAGNPKRSCVQMAWWGMLYPEFCFSQGKNSEQRVEQDENAKIPHRKISFWILSFID